VKLIKVQVAGIFRTTGLTVGAKYYVDDTGALSVTPSEVEVGYARSATELVLQLKGGI